MVRGNQLTIETFVGEAKTREEIAEVLRRRVYRRSRPSGMLRWMRRGVLPGLRRPDLNLVLGSPAIHSTAGLADWVEDAVGDLADS
jgi:hypothetical protein